MHDDTIHGRHRVELGSLGGYVFLSERGETLCFVPESLVVFLSDGAVAVDYLGYFLAGWSARNLRWSESNTGGSHVFPDVRRMINDQTAAGLPAQLARWRRLAIPFSL